ncbi:MAG: response regulator [Cyanobacteria bacterium P01_D01_bin.105]
MKLLLVEDDQTFAQSVQQLLEAHYYSVDWAADGQMAQIMAEGFAYDLILLDWVLPKKSGIEICKDLREAGDRTPIILITAKEDSQHEVAGLDAGADDYLVKPFGFEELLARIRAVLRRSEGIATPILAWGDLRLNPSSAEVSCCLPDGQQAPIALTPKEYGLLEVFLRNSSRIYSMDALIDKVWPYDDAPTTGAVRTHIKGLRQKLRAAGLSDVIDTVYGLGYRLSPATAVVCTPTNNHSSTHNHNQQKVPANNVCKQADKSPQAIPPIDLTALWLPVKENYLQRVTSLSKTLNSLHIGSLAASQRKQITAEAHALAGSLGSFGFSEATPQCRRIERLVTDCERFGREQLQERRRAIAKVQQTLIGPEPDGNAEPSSPESNPSPKSNKTETGNTRAAPLATVATAAALHTSSAKVLIVDDDAAMLSLLQSLLQDWGFQIRLLDNSQQFWAVMEQFVPDMVLLDVEMPEMSGFDLCEQLRDDPHWSELPVLFLSAHTEADTIQKVFSVGADDYIRKPIVAAELMARVVSWLERSRDRKLKAEVDVLTGLGNRQKSAQEITRLLSLAERYGQSFCLALIDINNFKRVNSQFGHAIGDRTLRHFGACLRSSFLTEDIVARWGGEEFVVGLYGVDSADAQQRLNTFRQRWHQVCATQQDITSTVTFSVGTATYPQDGADLGSLYQAADDSLQTTKQTEHKTALAGVR